MFGIKIQQVIGYNGDCMAQVVERRLEGLLGIVSQLDLFGTVVINKLFITLRCICSDQDIKYRR